MVVVDNVKESEPQRSFISAGTFIGAVVQWSTS